MTGMQLPGNQSIEVGDVVSQYVWTTPRKISKRQRGEIVSADELEMRKHYGIVRKVTGHDLYVFWPTLGYEAKGLGNLFCRKEEGVSAVDLLAQLEDV